MDKLKKFIIFITILLVLITIIICILIAFFNKKVNAENEKLLKESFNLNNKLEKISSMEEYIFIKECINKYINYSENVKDLNDEDDNITREDTIAQLKSIIPEFVIDDLKIDDDKLYDKIGIDNKSFRITNIYRSLQTVNTVAYEETTSIYAYYIEGIFIDKLNYEKKDFKMIIILDKINETFLVIPELYIESQNINLKQGEALSIYTKDSIEDKIFNVFYLRGVSGEEICQNYIADLKNNIIYDIEYVYNNILNSEYRKAKFNNIEEFKNYINKNYGNINKISLEKYKVQNKEQYKEYICIDKNGKMFIFYEKDVFNYYLVLDTYTIDLPEFIEKYNSSDEKTKVALNINKFISGINDKNYEYSYNILAESFKKNKYPNLDKFKYFIEKYLYEKNDVKFIEFSQQGNNYIYKVKIKDQNSEQEKDMTIVMKLHEGTNFEMSFNME